MMMGPEMRPRAKLQHLECGSSYSAAQEELIRRCRKMLVVSPMRTLLGEVPQKRCLPSPVRHGTKGIAAAENWGNWVSYKLASGDSYSRNGARRLLTEEAANKGQRADLGEMSAKRLRSAQPYMDVNSSAYVGNRLNPRSFGSGGVRGSSSSWRPEPSIKTWRAMKYNNAIGSNTQASLTPSRDDSILIRAFETSPVDKYGATLILQPEVEEEATRKPSRAYALTHATLPVINRNFGFSTVAENLEPQASSNNKYKDIDTQEERLIEQSHTLETLHTTSNSDGVYLFSEDASVNETLACKAPGQQRRRDAPQEKNYLVKTFAEKLPILRHDKHDATHEMNFPKRTAKDISTALQPTNTNKNKYVPGDNSESPYSNQNSASVRKLVPHESNTIYSTVTNYRLQSTGNGGRAQIAKPLMKNRPDIFTRLHNSQENLAAEAKATKSADGIRENSRITNSSILNKDIEKNRGYVLSAATQANKGGDRFPKTLHVPKQQTGGRQALLNSGDKLRPRGDSVLLVNYRTGGSTTNWLTQKVCARKANPKEARGKKFKRGPLVKLYEYNLNGHREKNILIRRRGRRTRQNVLRTKGHGKVPQSRRFRRSANVNLWKSRAASPATISRLWKLVDQNRQPRQKRKLIGEFGHWNTGSNLLFSMPNYSHGSLTMMDKFGASWKMSTSHAVCPEPLIEGEWEEQEEEEKDKDSIEFVGTSESNVTRRKRDNLSAITLSLKPAACEGPYGENSIADSSTEGSSGRDCHGCRPVTHSKGIQQKIDELEKSKVYLSSRPRERLLHLSPPRVEARRTNKEKLNRNKKPTAAPIQTWALEIAERKDFAKQQITRDIRARHKSHLTNTKGRTQSDPQQANTSMNKAGAAKRLATAHTFLAQQKEHKRLTSASMTGIQKAPVELYQKPQAAYGQGTERLRDSIDSVAASNWPGNKSRSGDRKSPHHSAKENSTSTANGVGKLHRWRKKHSMSNSCTDSSLCQRASLPGLKGNATTSSPRKKGKKNEMSGTASQKISPTAEAGAPLASLSQSQASPGSVCRASPPPPAKGFVSASDSRLENCVTLTRLSPALFSHTCDKQDSSNGGERSLSSLEPLVVNSNEDSATLSSEMVFSPSYGEEQEEENRRGSPVVRFGSSLTRRFRETVKAITAPRSSHSSQRLSKQKKSNVKD